MTVEIIEKANQFIRRSPFNRWLGMTCIGANTKSIVLTIKWREELISSPELRSTHGGVLAALIDCAADYAVAVQVGHPVPTMDLRVDYHRIAKPGDLRAEGKIISLGKRFATAEARVFDDGDNLVASGRGLYLIRAPEAPAQGSAASSN